jgi:hypothetical protein
MKEEKIKALMIEPRKRPCVVELGNDLDSLQKAVSIGADYQGLIEFVYLEDNVSVLLNEEGKIIGLEPNRRLGNDILVGVFYVVAEDEEGNLVSLSAEAQNKYSKMFWQYEDIPSDDIANTIFARFIGR